ncbi:MAG: DUF721 domain-containing protein [Nitrospirota bacterium]
MSNRLLPLSSVLNEFFQELDTEKKLVLYQISEHWEEMVGPQIVRHARPEKIWNQTLHIIVDSAPWINQLHFLKKEITEKINWHLKEILVKEITFRIGSFPKVQKEGTILDTNQKRPRAGKSDYPPAEISALIAQIELFEDSAIRKIIKEALEGYTGHP